MLGDSDQSEDLTILIHRKKEEKTAEIKREQTG